MRLPPESTLILPVELTAPVIVALKLLLNVVGTANASRPEMILMAGYTVGAGAGVTGAPVSVPLPNVTFWFATICNRSTATRSAARALPDA